MKTIFEITPNENDLDISTFKYQVELTKKLDNINSDFNQEILNEIILWKVNIQKIKNKGIILNIN